MTGIYAIWYSNKLDIYLPEKTKQKNVLTHDVRCKLIQNLKKILMLIYKYKY